MPDFGLNISGFSDLSSVDLHDAVIRAVNFSAFGVGCCSIELLVYENSAAVGRVKAFLEFEGVRSGVCSLDLPGILDNSGAGNVMTCRVNVEGGVVRLYLVEGFIEVSSESVALRFSA